MKNIVAFLSVVMLSVSCTETLVDTQSPSHSKSVQIVHFKDVKWEKLNPARGDSSPQAADLWGNRKAENATGFVVKFIDGFSSPPHIHNVTYRAIVLNGSIHNDDPSATEMWMEPGSFWTQPAGESHITSAQGKINMAYVEIDEGPYLVRPVDSAFINGVRPVNLTPENMVWQKTNHPDAEITYLWGDLDETYGAMIRLSSNFQGTIKNEGTEFKSVIVDGAITYGPKDRKELLTVGSLVSVNEQNEQSLVSSDSSTLLYVRTNGKVEVFE